MKIDMTTGQSIPAPSIHLRGLLGALHMFQIGHEIYLVTGISYLESSSTSSTSVLG